MEDNILNQCDVFESGLTKSNMGEFKFWLISFGDKLDEFFTIKDDGIYRKTDDKEINSRSIIVRKKKVHSKPKYVIYGSNYFYKEFKVI